MIVRNKSGISSGSRFKYTGYDLSEDMLDLATQTILVSGAPVTLNLIGVTKEISSHEYIVASGIFNMKQNVDSSSWMQYVLEQLNIIDEKSSKGFAFNMLTSYSDNEFMRDDLFTGILVYFLTIARCKYTKSILVT